MKKYRYAWVNAWWGSLAFHIIAVAVLSAFMAHHLPNEPARNKPIEIELVAFGGGGGGGGKKVPEEMAEAFKELPPVAPVKQIEQEMLPQQRADENSIAAEHKEVLPSAPSNTTTTDSNSETSGTGPGSGGGSGGDSGGGSGPGSGTGVGPGSGSGSGGGSGDGSGAFVRPVTLSAPEPHYPEQARRENREGTVTVGLTIGTDGTVSDAWVNGSSGYGDLDEAAVAAVRNWFFAPAKRGNTPIESTTSVSIVFNLRNR